MATSYTYIFVIIWKSKDPRRLRCKRWCISLYFLSVRNIISKLPKKIIVVHFITKQNPLKNKVSYT